MLFKMRWLRNWKKAITMIDYPEATHELKDTEKRIKNNFTELTALDYQRVDHFHDYIKHHRPEDIGRFLNETIASNLLLKNVEKDFHKMLGYVLLIEKEGHKHDYFKILLKRTRYLESILHNLFNQRQTQIKICRSLLSAESITTKIVFIRKVVSLLEEKRLILSFGKEKNLVALFGGIFKHEKERIDAMFQAYLNENRKDMVMAGVSLTIVVLVPMVGAALGLAVYAALQWANRSSSNYNKLMGHLKDEGSDGPAV